MRVLEVIDLRQRVGGAGELGVIDDVAHPLAIDPDGARAAQALQELLTRPLRHRALWLRKVTVFKTGIKRKSRFGGPHYGGEARRASRRRTCTHYTSRRAADLFRSLPPTACRQVIRRRERMDAQHMLELGDAHGLVGRAHALRRRTIDERRLALHPPEPRVGP